MSLTKNPFSFHAIVLFLFLIAAVGNIAIQGAITISMAYTLFILSIGSYAFYTRNVFIVAAVFLASLYMETGWIMQCVTQFFSYTPVRGLPLFQLQPAHPYIDLVVNSYHFFLLPLLVHACYKTRHVLGKHIKVIGY